MLNDPSPEPIFIDEHSGHPALRERFGAVGALATVAVPLTTGEHFLGAIAVSVMERPERLQPSAELLDQLSGAAALATTALQNGRLVDEITHQALHDSLTGLTNRGALMEHLRDAIIR